MNVAGQATAIRFYKGSANTGEHTGYLWRDYGAKLAEVTFADETEDGWQTAYFATPVDLEPGYEYRVGLYSTTGRYAVDINGFQDGLSSGPFSVPAEGSAYAYSREYPVRWSPHNYWVDVLFTPAG